MDAEGNYHGCDRCDYVAPDEWHACDVCGKWHRPATEEEDRVLAGGPSVVDLIRKDRDA